MTQFTTRNALNIPKLSHQVYTYFIVQKKGVTSNENANVISPDIVYYDSLNKLPNTKYIHKYCDGEIGFWARNRTVDKT